MAAGYGGYCRAQLAGVILPPNTQLEWSVAASGPLTIDEACQLAPALNAPEGAVSIAMGHPITIAP